MFSRDCIFTFIAIYYKQKYIMYILYNISEILVKLQSASVVRKCCIGYVDL